MAFWLLKSEPETWSWESQVKKGTKGEPWSGVRNYQARLNLRAMKKGERAFFYHSGELRAVVGIVEIVKEAYPDHSAEKGEWSMVDVVAVEPFKVPVTLVDAKAAAPGNPTRAHPFRFCVINRSQAASHGEIAGGEFRRR